MVTEYDDRGASAAGAAARAAALVGEAWAAWRGGDGARARRLADEAWAALAGSDAGEERRRAAGEWLEELEGMMAARPDAAGVDRLLARLEEEGKEQPEPPGSLARLLERLDEELGPVGEE